MWTTIINLGIKLLDFALTKINADAAKKKAFIEFVLQAAPDMASSARCFEAYKGLQGSLDEQKKALLEQSKAP